MTPRITINVRRDGELEIWLNEEGRDLLVQELQSLDRENDHLHLTVAGPFDVELSSIPYRSDDKCIESATILFRPDDWDREHYPHVMAARPNESEA